MLEVLAVEPFIGWYLSLDEEDLDAVTRAVETLQMAGVALRHPDTSAVHGATFELRELRVRSARGPLRVLYAIDEARKVVLVIGGSDTALDRCEKTWRKYQRSRWNR